MPGPPPVPVPDALIRRLVGVLVRAVGIYYYYYLSSGWPDACSAPVLLQGGRPLGRSRT